MNKKIIFSILCFFTGTFLFAQNAPQAIETDKTQSQQSTDSLTHAPEQKNEVRDFQLTFLTPLGTNGTNASKITNHVSVNIFAGINGGLDGIEVGGFANIITGRAEGLQAAGFANVVTREFEGIQFAGFANTNLKKSEGIQAAGFVNTSLGGIDGAQLAGFANISKGNSQGIQASGFINYAKNMDGAQFGFINIADTLDGVAIGFLSFARNGYHTLEASTNETFHTNLAFKTGGNRHFYNIFAAGIRWYDNDLYWAFGYGVGTNFKISKKLELNIDAVSYAVIPQNIDIDIDDDWDWDDDDFGAVGKLNFGLSYKIAKHFTVFGGPTLNALINQNRSFIDNINPAEILSVTDDDFNFLVYPGFNVGIRI